MKRSFTCLLMLFLALKTIAQEQPTRRQQADRLFERYEYFKSLNLYLPLAKKKHVDVHLLERVADCYRNMGRLKDAEVWYARAAADTGAAIETHYDYAEALLYNQKFGHAKQQYQIYFDKVNDPYLKSIKMFACDSAAVWMAQPSSYTVKSSANLNSAFSEWGLINDGEGWVIFTSDRRLTTDGIDGRTGNNFFKLYKANANGENAREIYVINGENGGYINNHHVGPIALNAKGDTAYITVTTDVPAKKIVTDKPGKKSSQKLYTRRLQLLMAVLKNGQWVSVGGFPYNNINEYSIGQAELSKDGKLIYFTSDMPGGEGKTDIWYCEKQADGQWGKPINCGATINTKEEEAFPEMGGDGVLYYSSKGLPGMGGYDIYSAKGEKTAWDIPVNLKYLVNSTGDDFCLVTRDGSSGYFSSNRPGGMGDDDIYRFDYKKPVVPTTAPVKATDTPGRNLTGGSLVKKPGSFIVNNIYYDLDKSTIRGDAAIELDKLVAILKNSPAYTVSISSYADSRASAAYNLALSGRRSAAVVSYLVNKGIDISRLIVANFGDTHLVNGCAKNVKCTEEEQQLNRRTEFKLVEK